MHLICHDHDLAVTQTLEGFWVAVVLLVLKAEDLNDVVDFSILHDLMRKTKKYVTLSSLVNYIRDRFVSIQDKFNNMQLDSLTHSLTCLSEASRTLSIFPLRGKTP